MTLERAAHAVAEPSLETHAETRAAAQARRKHAMTHARRKFVTAFDALVGELLESMEELEREVVRLQDLQQRTARSIRPRAPGANEPG